MGYPDSDTGRKPCLSIRWAWPGRNRGGDDLINDATPDRISARSRTGGRAGFFRLLDVPVEKNTGPVGFTEKDGKQNRFVARRAPFRVYDAMQPVGARLDVKAATQAVRVHIPVPRDARPGQCDHILSVASGKDVHELKLSVAVHKPVIPPVGRNSWPYTNWFSLGNMAARHGLKQWSEGHWAMIGKYARLMARNRQNTFWFTFGDVFTPGKSGLLLNRDRIRRIVDTFTRAGILAGVRRPNGHALRSASR